jgi:hypothetical protein
MIRKSKYTLKKTLQVLPNNIKITFLQRVLAKAIILMLSTILKCHVPQNTDTTITKY